MNGQHPWRKPERHLEDDEHTVCRHPPSPTPRTPRRTVFGLELPIAILSFVLVLVVASLVLVAGLLGHKINQLEKNVPLSSLPINNTSNEPNQPNQSNESPSTLAPVITETIQVTVPGWSYVGCFYDTVNRTLLEGYAYDKENMTNQFCADKCTDKVYQYFGTQHRRCYCDGTSERLKRAPDWGCQAQCPGQKNLFEACGGETFHLSVWKRT
ncbi:hypothetical protein QBC35DRAFT_499490 [Podospora australis]|uniref:WSC domain-containing protein n=1 Tax=Podospora australis TaxID=1536484 RepID=A0AAN7AIR7_9PEZI|nr:hypothetical protein QBC35DRAFT_499490 [Podospora australis]